MVIKCKVCGEEVTAPSLEHVKGHMQKEMEKVKESDPSEYFEAGFRLEWD